MLQLFEKYLPVVLKVSNYRLFMKNIVDLYRWLYWMWLMCYKTSSYMGGVFQFTPCSYIIINSLSGSVIIDCMSGRSIHVLGVWMFLWLSVVRFLTSVRNSCIFMGHLLVSISLLSKCHLIVLMLPSNVHVLDSSYIVILLS